jgi:hypothetical protein
MKKKQQQMPGAHDLGAGGITSGYDAAQNGFYPAINGG